MQRVRDGLALFGAGAIALALLIGLFIPESAARAQEPSGALGLSIEGAGVTCASADACDVALGGDFTLTISVTEAPSEGYIGIGTQVQYRSLVYHPTSNAEDEIVIAVDGFPGITVRAPEEPSGEVDHGTTAGTPPTFTTSHFEGPVIELAMTCSSDDTRNEVTLSPYAPENTLGSGFKLPVDAGASVVPASDSLVVNCGSPPPDGNNGEPTEGPDGPNGGPGVATPDLDTPEGQATATAMAEATAEAEATVSAGATATAEAAGGEDDGDDDDGSSSTGIWIALGVIAAVAVVAGGGYYLWRRNQAGSGGADGPGPASPTGGDAGGDPSAPPSSGGDTPAAPGGDPPAGAGDAGASG